MWIAPLLGYLGTFACAESAKLGRPLELTNSYLSVLLFAGFTMMAAKALEVKASKADWICGGIGALFVSVCLGFGRRLDLYGNVDFLSPWMWLVILCMAVFLVPLIVWGFSGMDWLGRRLAEGPAGADDKAAESGSVSATEQSSKKSFWLTAVLLFLCWTPIWLAAWPGFFGYDATDELTQVTQQAYLTRHPLLHVLLLGGIVSGVYELTGNWNTGIAVYEVFQMAVMAGVFSWLLGFLKKTGAPKIVRVFSFVYLAFFPVISVFVLCTSKDTLYCAGMLAVLILLVWLVTEPEVFRKKRLYPAVLSVSLFTMAVFRNNGFYVFLVMIPVMLWMAGKIQWKKMLLILVCAFLLIQGNNSLLRALLSPQDTGTMETLTVPIQQLTRAYIFSPELYSEEEKEILYEILPQEVLERYNPKLSDMVKIDFQTEIFEKDPGKYISLWADIGLRAPFTYVNAWLMTSYGFWYPDTVIDVYNGQRYYTESSYFTGETEEPGVRQSKFVLLERVIKKFSWGILQQRIPVLSMLFSPGFLCWIYVLGGLYLLARGQLKLFAAFGPVYLNWLTVLLGPTYLVRYVLIFWFALPLFVWMVVMKKKV